MKILKNAQCERGMSQLQWIEKYIVGKKKKIKWITTKDKRSWLSIIPDHTKYDGVALLHYTAQASDITLENLIDYEYYLRCLYTKLGNLGLCDDDEDTQLLHRGDGGIITRGNSPFLDDPEPPNFVLRENLPASSSLTSKVTLIQSALKTFRRKESNTDNKFKLPPEESTALKLLMNPYVKTMSNLVGGVHSCTTDTMLNLVNLLDFDPQKTVLLECGSGAPFLGLSASIFAKQTICLDLPAVLKTIFWILSFMSPEDKQFAETIHFVPGFDFLFLILKFLS